jgi:hypothetical protein
LSSSPSKKRLVIVGGVVRFGRRAGLSIDTGVWSIEEDDMRATRTSLAVTVAAIALIALPGAALAKPLTFTTHETFSETFADEPSLCMDELYETSVEGRYVSHLTIETDENGEPTLPLYFHDRTSGDVVAVPVDGTGPTFTGQFWTSDSESIRSVRNGALFVETDTDRNHVILWGSDGSKVSADEHHHFTFNANGDVTIEFDKVALDC